MSFQSTVRSIPSLEESAGRVISNAFFPTSPAATVREAIFSEILAEVLNTEPEIRSLKDFYEKVEDKDIFETDEHLERAIDIFSATYTTTGERGARGKEAQRYVIPFHPAIATAIKPEETRNWGKWYRMLMTKPDGSLNRALHTRFVERLEAQNASNLFEQVFVNVADDLSEEMESDSSVNPIRPYVTDCASAFQEDLSAWLKDDYDSPSNWLQSTRDLFCFHFMVYYIQLSLNLRREFEHVSTTPTKPYSPEIIETYFGMWDESATHDRQFSREWRERGRNGIEGDIYDSWGRLAVLRIITETVAESPLVESHETYTLSEAVHELPPKLKRQCAEAVESHFAEDDRDANPDLHNSARRLTRAVRKNYEERSSSNQTPITMGINVVRQLGDGTDRKFWRTQRKIGPTLRLNRGALRFLARLFTTVEDDVHYDMFIEYLERRGVFLDSQSQRTALEELEEMGMINRQSDSGGAVYVRSI